MRITKEEKEAAFRYISEYKGSRIAACVKSVSRSGMCRRIDFYVLYTEKGTAHLYRITHLIGRILDWSYDINKGGLRVSGCGMDMVFHTISTLNYAFAQWKNKATLAELTGKGGKLEGKRIYDNYLFDANDIYHI